MVSLSNYGLGVDQVGKVKMAILKKSVWIDDDGKIAEGDSMPSKWKKGKLLGAKGQEVTDAQAKEWGIGSKAKAPAENKGK
tara:strand:+ start:5976 stop:6218 length:243 start_codon:yes stop_codon:yes gene_type:complete